MSSGQCDGGQCDGGQCDGGQCDGGQCDGGQYMTKGDLRTTEESALRNKK